MRSSPSPSPAGSSRAIEARRPRSAQTQTVAVNMVEAPNQQGARHFQLHVSECVETKTVTTTTRLTRKFPQVFVRDPTPLASLDAKEYPLAMKPTPPELAGFSFTYPSHADEEEYYEEEEEQGQRVKQEADDDANLSANEASVSRLPHSQLNRLVQTCANLIPMIVSSAIEQPLHTGCPRTRLLDISRFTTPPPLQPTFLCLTY